jgi:dTDP-4-amino-4,6-dideoxygalactose transaminase
MLDLKAQYATIRDEVNDAVLGVLADQQFRGGPVVESFERAIAEFTGAPHALGVATGTDAILLPLKALCLQPGDEVITTPWTFFATGGAIVNAGGTPVFVDIDPASYNMNPELVEAAITPRTRAIVAVHIYGQCADMDALLAIAARHNLPVLEDAAQSLGARYRGRPAGSMGVATGVSFYPTKNLGAAGEGGLVLATDERMANTVRMLRSHGANQTYHHEIVGTNSHLHAMQAAVLNVKLRRLPAWNEARRAVAARYTAALAGAPGVVCPVECEGNYHVWHQYVLRVPRRDEAVRHFKARGVGCGVFYPLPLHRQPCFAHLDCGRFACPEADRASEEVLALPIYPELTEGQIDEVIATLHDHLAVH